MSHLHVEPIKVVEREFEAARHSLPYLSLNYTRLGITEEDIRHRDLERALKGLEDTYIVRLTAACERILADHLDANHPGTIDYEKTGGMELVDAVAAKNSPKIAGSIAEPVREVFRFRNGIAHGRPRAIQAIPFSQARSRLAAFLPRVAWCCPVTQTGVEQTEKSCPSQGCQTPESPFP